MLTRAALRPISFFVHVLAPSTRWPWDRRRCESVVALVRWLLGMEERPVQSPIWFYAAMRVRRTHPKKVGHSCPTWSAKNGRPT